MWNIDNRSMLFYLIFCELLTILFFSIPFYLLVPVEFCFFFTALLYHWNCLSQRAMASFRKWAKVFISFHFRRSIESGLRSFWSAGSCFEQRLAIEPRFFVSSLKRKLLTFCSIGSVCMERRRHCQQGKKPSRNVSKWLNDWLTD